MWLSFRYILINFPADLLKWVDLADQEWNLLASNFQVKTAQKQEYILLPGAKGHELYFVCSGLLRFYYITDDGMESNKAFIPENTFAGSLAAYNLDLPILYGVQALEPTMLLAANFSDFVALFEQHPIFDRLGRKLAEWLLIRKELRARSLLQQQATERYLDFVKQYPDLAKRVPQYHIASYLGITEVSLSRLKRTA
ncbi:Crp/Fnr family transcriptional regulator [Tolypothrix sp. NIES-4075]|uniref:Crp/Fnr family transcriptional regulator n=1 Tax=Tolypothrix sp. NIES-4075 TaxID=2005459 RepID=UPI000B5CC848